LRQIARTAWRLDLMDGEVRAQFDACRAAAAFAFIVQLPGRFRRGDRRDPRDREGRPRTIAL